MEDRHVLSKGELGLNRGRRALLLGAMVLLGALGKTAFDFALRSLSAPPLAPVAVASDDDSDLLRPLPVVAPTPPPPPKRKKSARVSPPAARTAAAPKVEAAPAPETKAPSAAAAAPVPVVAPSPVAALLPAVAPAPAPVAAPYTLEVLPPPPPPMPAPEVAAPAVAEPGIGWQSRARAFTHVRRQRCRDRACHREREAQRRSAVLRARAQTLSRAQGPRERRDGSRAAAARECGEGGTMISERPELTRCVTRSRCRTSTSGRVERGHLRSTFRTRC